MKLEKHIDFFQREIDEAEYKWEETYNSPASLLCDNGELFVGRFEKLDEKRGALIFSFPVKLAHLPRINEEFSCFVARSIHEKFMESGNTTYRDLSEGLGENDITEIRLVNYYSGPDPARIGVIFTGANTDFIERLKPKMSLFIGPKEPPLEYLGNLKGFSERLNLKPVAEANSYLEETVPINLERLPIGLLEEQNIPDLLLSELERNDLILLQGPPGVGKTHLAAQLIGILIDQGHSILLTALTNKASVEVCSKELFKSYMNRGVIGKVSLKSDEKRLYPTLLAKESVTPIKGGVVLATYYTFSRIWEDLTTPIFDYVIVEEASQAFLTTIAAAKLVGKKVIVIGDFYQIPPIVTQNIPEQVDKDINRVIHGLESFCTFEKVPYYRKLESRRLSKRAVEYTNIFYGHDLISLVNPDIDQARSKFTELGKYLHPKGGPSLITMSLPFGKIVPKIREFIVSVLKDGPQKGFTIAILAPFRETVGEMQGKIMKALNNYDIIIDTVDRVQGLDVDLCFYVIPKMTYDRGMSFNRFNVATSRSKIATFILSDESIRTTNAGHPLAVEYIRKLTQEFSFKI